MTISVFECVCAYVYRCRLQVDFFLMLIDIIMGVLRLGGHGAAAFALWWLEVGSNSENFHFDQAGVAFQVTQITKCFWQILVAGASQ